LWNAAKRGDYWRQLRTPAAAAHVISHVTSVVRASLYATSVVWLSDARRAVDKVSIKASQCRPGNCSSSTSATTRVSICQTTPRYAVQGIVLQHSTSNTCYAYLLHVVLSMPIFQHSVRSVITAHKLTPDKVRRDHRESCFTPFSSLLPTDRPTFVAANNKSVIHTYIHTYIHKNF